jgi:UPF0755 protein
VKNDIIPPRRDSRPPLTSVPPAPYVTPGIEAAEPMPATHQAIELPKLEGEAGTTPPRRPSWRRRIMLIVGGILLLGVGGVLAGITWYTLQLRPLSNDPKATHVRLSIESGTGADAIGSVLADKHLVRDAKAFSVYVRLHHLRGQFQAGTYSLSPSLSTPEIVNHLISGKTDQISITFLPGATLAENRQALIKSGYSQGEVDEAFSRSYNQSNPLLFVGKPAAATLEGYIYGDTYEFASDATVDQILNRTFQEFNGKITPDLIEGFKQRGLTLYQGIVLASIIQREVSSPHPNEATQDQKQVAQIFYARLSRGMPLGSDVTAYYGADQIGVPRSVAVDTPYNTRIHTGLPPGPIATPGLGALIAAAHPASGDYLYFLSGDDNITYYAKTNEEHIANIRNHCQVKCALP